jgi:2-polyprenyl-3-methyl-5-hydroxy-6-metoxy-1,4-benzoquinol methylase
LDSAARFDAHYYQRFYENPATRATTPQAVRRQAAFVAAYLRHLGIPVRRILDIGCGLGWMISALANEFPKAGCSGVEYSEHLCATLGWQHGSVTDYASRRPYDLVVCHDVLPSLNDANCARAIDNLAQLCRGALYLGALTAEDWERCDQARTDADVFLRPAAWYRRRLARHFESAGGGIFVKRTLELSLWALETV